MSAEQYVLKLSTSSDVYTHYLQPCNVAKDWCIRLGGGCRLYSMAVPSNSSNANTRLQIGVQ